MQDKRLPSWGGASRSGRRPRWKLSEYRYGRALAKRTTVHWAEIAPMNGKVVTSELKIIYYTFFIAKYRQLPHIAHAYVLAGFSFVSLVCSYADHLNLYNYCPWIFAAGSQWTISALFDEPRYSCRSQSQYIFVLKMASVMFAETLGNF